MSTTSASTAGRRGPRHPLAFKAAAGIAATAVAGLAITAGGVYALLSAEAFNSENEAVTSGTLTLTLTKQSTSQGFGQDIKNLAPGDVVNRFVQVTNGTTLADSLDGASLGLRLTDGTPTLLTTDATNGLQVTIQSCSVPWTFTASTTTCPSSGVQGSELTTSARALVAASATTPYPLGVSTFPANTSIYYKIGVGLPSTVTETSTNGTLPPVGSIQGLAASLRWTFSEQQRAAVATNN